MLEDFSGNGFVFGNEDFHCGTLVLR
jgi:hypothetical protein